MRGTPRHQRLAPALMLAAGLWTAACGSDRVPVENPLGQATASASNAPTGRASPTASGTATPSASGTPTPRPSGVAATCAFSVCIDAPDGSSTITSPVTVEGNAAVEGGALTVEIRQGDRDSRLLGSAVITATASVPDRGTFSVSVTFTPIGEGGRIYAFSTRSPAQHSWIVVRF